MKNSFIVILQILLDLAGSDYLYHHDPPAGQHGQTLVLDSDRIYGVREPEGFEHQNLTCQPGSEIVINSVKFGYEELGQIPLCGEAGYVLEQCVVPLSVERVECQLNSCRFPSLANWGDESFKSMEKCGGGLQYWHICYDCIGAEYATEVINDVDHADEAYDYYQGDDGEYYYYYSDMYHPQVTNRFDVDGYDDITCDHGDLIKILSAKFGYDEQSLKSDQTDDPCVFDFTHQFSADLCTDKECKSPTLKQLGLSNSVACGQSPGLGLWQIHYTCEKVGDIDIHEPQKSHDMSDQLETHVESIENSIDSATNAPFNFIHQSATEKNIGNNDPVISETSLETVKGDRKQQEEYSIIEESISTTTEYDITAIEEDSTVRMSNLITLGEESHENDITEKKEETTDSNLVWNPSASSPTENEILTTFAMEVTTTEYVNVKDQDIINAPNKQIGKEDGLEFSWGDLLIANSENHEKNMNNLSKTGNINISDLDVTPPEFNVLEEVAKKSNDNFSDQSKIILNKHILENEADISSITIIPTLETKNNLDLLATPSPSTRYTQRENDTKENVLTDIDKEKEYINFKEVEKDNYKNHSKMKIAKISNEHAEVLKKQDYERGNNFENINNEVIPTQKLNGTKEDFIEESNIKNTDSEVEEFSIPDQILIEKRTKGEQFIIERQNLRNTEIEIENASQKPKDEISGRTNFEPYSILDQFTDPNISQTTLKTTPEMHQKPGTHFEEHQSANKSQDVVLPWQHPSSSMFHLNDLSNTDINNVGKYGPHKHLENSSSDKNSDMDHNTANVDRNGNFSGDKNLVKPKANFEHQSETVSKMTEQGSEESDMDSFVAKCKGGACIQDEVKLVESTTLTTDDSENNSVQTVGHRNKNIADKPSLSSVGKADISTITSLQESDGDRKSEHILTNFGSQSSTLDPSISIIFDERAAANSENKSHHIVNQLTTDNENNSKVPMKSLESDRTNKPEKTHYKTSRFPSKNKSLFVNSRDFEPSDKDDSSLDISRHESFINKEDNLTTEEDVESGSDMNNINTKEIAKEDSDRKNRREKLLVEKGHFRVHGGTNIKTEESKGPIGSTTATTTISSTSTTTTTRTTTTITTTTSTTTTATTTTTTTITTTSTTTKKIITSTSTEKIVKIYTHNIDQSTTSSIEVDSYSDQVNEEESKYEENDNIEEEIEEEISQGINQLKSELKMLLTFNDNVLDASNEIIKEATKAKVETFFESVSTSLNELSFQKKIHKKDKSAGRKQSETKKKEEINTATSILNITADISKTLASTVEVGSKVDIKLPNISMTVMKKKMGVSNSSVWEADSLSVKLPDQATIAGSDSSITVSFTSYDNLGSMMSMDDDFSSSVLSVNVLGVQKVGNTIPLTKPIEFLLRHKPMHKFSDRKCVYWDFGETGWSQKGCYALKEASTEETTTCQCYHLTNFAVLIDVYGLAQSEQHKNNLDLLTWIGCGVSITSLSICIYVFSTFRSAKNDRSTINSNLCFCLLLAELFFLCGIGQTSYPSFCSVVAAVLHYLFLASFFWMLIAGFQIYVLLVEVFEPDGSRFVQYYLLGYIVPLLIVLCSLLMDTLLNYESVYGFRDFCWINSNIHLVLSFLMPVFLIVGANIYFLSVAVYKIHVHSKESLIVHKSKTASLKLYVKGLFGLLFLLGVTWVFGIVSVTHPSLTFTYIFTILNSLHGFFIFIFNCVWNKKIRNEGRNKIEDLLSCMVQTRRRHLVSRKESTLSNTSATSQTNSTMVKEYFLPEMPYTIDPKPGVKKSKQNALSITYYY